MLYVEMQAGYFDDLLPGAAHFLEHMVHLGSDTFPDEREYKAFLAAHGGSSNASTSETQQQQQQQQQRQMHSIFLCSSAAGFWTMVTSLQLLPAAHMSSAHWGGVIKQ
jgi:hypothetical protein